MDYQKRRWIALVVLLSAGFMDLLDLTIVNVTIPTIMKGLNAQYDQIEWIVASYMLGFAALLITGGRLGDTYGRKRMFLIGVAGFTVMSLVCGVATGPEMLIGARFLQGMMSGLMVPQILSIVHATFPPEERGKVLGIWGGAMGSASAIGLAAGGLLVHWNPAGLEWRSIFLVNIPVGVAAFVAAWFVVGESRSPSASRPDLVGVVLSITGILMLVYPLAEGRQLGWPAWTFALMAGSAVVLAAFVWYEAWRTRTVGSPLVALNLFRAKAFSVGLALYLIFWVALGGFFLVWTLYMQAGLGWTALRAGLTAISFAVGAAAGSGLSVQVFTPRFGRRVLMAGALLNAAGFVSYLWAVDHYGPGIHPWQMLAPLVVTGFGFGLVVAPIVDAILTGVPLEDAGSGSGLLNTTQQVGMALGIALVGVLFFGRLDHDSERGVDAVVPDLRRQLTAAAVPAPAQQSILNGFRTCVQERSAATDPMKVPASCRTGGDPRLTALLTQAGVRANAHNFAHAFGVTLWCGTGFLAVVFAGMFALPRQVRIRELGGEPAPRVELDQRASR